MFLRKTILFNIPKVTNKIRSYSISLKEMTDIERRIGAFLQHRSLYTYHGFYINARKTFFNP